MAIWISCSAAVLHAQTDQDPVILIPGVTGSELLNKQSGEVVWLRTRRSKVDDLRLPITADPLKSRDGLVPGDILRTVKLAFLPRTDVYQGLIDALKTRGGYHEENWETPTANAGKKALYVFAYDWRLDNVENARLLIRKIEDLRRRTKNPRMKFNIIAHSMGGMIARYAAMYGDADLPAAGRKPVPTWAGAKFFDKVVLMGTPNEGSSLTLEAMLKGVSLGPYSINLPFIQNISKFDVFTLPAAYQLLPSPGSFRVVDEELQPMDLDLYDPAVWARYGWNAIDDPKFAKEFKRSEQKLAASFFNANLARAKRLHEALEAPGDAPASLKIELIGSECKDTLDTVVLVRDVKRNAWRTLFKADSFVRANGEKVLSEDLKKVIYVPGDGVVTKNSFEASEEAKTGKPAAILHPASVKFVCEDHNKLATNSEIQDYLLELLSGK